MSMKTYLNSSIFHQLKGNADIVKFVNWRSVDVTVNRQGSFFRRSGIGKWVGGGREDVTKGHEVTFKHAHQKDQQESVAELIRVEINTSLPSITFNVDFIQVTVDKVHQRPLHDLQFVWSVVKERIERVARLDSHSKLIIRTCQLLAHRSRVQMSFSFLKRQEICIKFEFSRHENKFKFHESISTCTTTRLTETFCGKRIGAR